MKFKTKYKEVVLILVLIISFIALVISLYHIIVWKKENDAVDKTLKDIAEVVKPIEKEDSSNVEFVEPEDDVDKYKSHVL